MNVNDLYKEVQSLRRDVARLGAQQAQQIPKGNWGATVVPGTGNDNTEGYSAGSLWFNNTAADLYVCTSAATGAATWEKLTA